MSLYSRIVIIYNPNSTGSSEALARQLFNDLQTELPDEIIKIQATQHAGHAETLAYETAIQYPGSLVIGASGDGGYHEIVNGILQARAEGAEAFSGLLPAGNANDHYNAVHDGELIEAIKHKREKVIDVLKLTTTQNNKPYQRFAHSYIGIGLTPKVGYELNKTKLNLFVESWIFIRVLLRFRGTRVKYDGEIHRFDSLVCTNIKRMSKYFSIAKSARPDDGLFEVTMFRRRNRFQLLWSMLHASSRGIESDLQTKSFTFETIRRTLVQMDGEIIRADARTIVKIVIVPAELHCII